ncbi:SDR family NAD(P)-dependent oxidoreductase [Candidatus Poriferisocius sp.]|uniref:SDR family NAD(P)-dependent oxidoreductase n=1 Tax=Candidatus Poriferisocius sp. TaxID=3101276 RepID=UPI003B58FDE3
MADKALAGKKAIVTGGGRGIGRAIALAFANSGADIGVIGRTTKPLEATAAAVRDLGRNAEVEVADLTDVGSIPSLFERLADRLDGFDILVNSAGVQLTAPALEVSEQDWDATLDINLKALFFCCQAAGRHFVEQGAGKIINLASTFSVVGFPEFVAYCASKGGVMQLTRTLALEWASRGVNVNAIAPTAVRTEMNAYLLDDPGFLEAFIPHVPAGRVGQPDDVAGSAVFLASSASDFVHGHLLFVDGGYTAV